MVPWILAAFSQQPFSERLPIFCHKQVATVHNYNVMASAVLLAWVATLLARKVLLLAHGILFSLE